MTIHLSPSSLKELCYTFSCIKQLQSCKFKDQMDLLSVCELNWHLRKFAGVQIPDSMAGLNFKVFSEFYCFLDYISLKNKPITDCVFLHFLNGKIEMTKQSQAIFLIWSIDNTLFEPEAGSQEVHTCQWEQGDTSSLGSLRIMHVYTGTQKYFFLKERH